MMLSKIYSKQEKNMETKNSEWRVTTVSKPVIKLAMEHVVIWFQ